MFASQEIEKWRQEQWVTLAESDNAAIFRRRITDRIQSVIDAASGRKTWSNEFGLRSNQELFHWVKDDLINPRWIAGSEFPFPQEVGQTLVWEAINAMNLERVQEEEEPPSRTSDGYVIIKTNTTFRAPNAAEIIVRKTLVGVPIVGTQPREGYEAAGSFLYETPWIEKRIDVMVPRHTQ